MLNVVSLWLSLLLLSPTPAQASMCGRNLKSVAQKIVEFLGYGDGAFSASPAIDASKFENARKEFLEKPGQRLPDDSVEEQAAWDVAIAEKAQLGLAQSIQDILSGPEGALKTRLMDFYARNPLGKVASHEALRLRFLELVMILKGSRFYVWNLFSPTKLTSVSHTRLWSSVERLILEQGTRAWAGPLLKLETPRLKEKFRLWLIKSGLSKLKLGANIDSDLILQAFENGLPSVEAEIVKRYENAQEREIRRTAIRKAVIVGVVIATVVGGYVAYENLLQGREHDQLIGGGATLDSLFDQVTPQQVPPDSVAQFPPLDPEFP